MIYTRLSYNTNNWESPSGSFGKSRKFGVHEFDYKFGFEEWLRSPDLLLSDKMNKRYHFGYIEGVHKNYNAGDENDYLKLFTINNNLHQRFFVGEIKRWKPVSQEESNFIVLNNQNIVQNMRNQLAATIGITPNSLNKFDQHRDSQNGYQLFNIKYEQFNFVFNMNNQVPINHPTRQLNRFFLYRR